MALIAGSYERFLFGFSHPASFKNKDAFELKSIFTYPAHKGVVKSLACAGPFLVSGGADDLIHLYDMKFEKDLGFLVNPGVGAITAMEFFTPKDAFRPTHLLAGCADGTLTVWSVSEGWQCMKTLRGHRHEVSSIAIHETGVLALTTSRDKTLRLWDLVKGRTTFQSKLEEEAEQVAFSPSGTMYALRSGKVVSVFRVGSEGDQKACIALEHSRRVTSFCFGNEDDAIITGTEDGVVRAWHVPDSGASRPPSIIVELEGAHSSRIKAFAIPKTYTVVHKGSVNDDGDDDRGAGLPEAESSVLAAENLPAFVASASSDGHISVWNLQKAVKAAISSKSPIQEAAGFCLSSANTKARLTTLCAMDSVDMMEVKALELSMKSKSKKKERKKNASKKSVVAAGKPPGRATPTSKKQRDEQPSDLKERQRRQKEHGQGPKTIVHGADRVVSFLDEKDADRQAKQKKKVEIQSKRKMAQHQAGRSKRKVVTVE